MKNKKTLLISGLLFTAMSVNCYAGLPDEIMKTLKGTSPDYKSLSISAPEIAENGAMVNIKIKKMLPFARNEFVSRLNIYSDFRKTRPIASFKLGAQSVVDGMKLRIRLRKTANVYVVAKLNSGRVLTAKKKIKVTIGGCGGTVNKNED